MFAEGVGGEPRGDKTWKRNNANRVRDVAEEKTDGRGGGRVRTQPNGQRMENIQVVSARRETKCCPSFCMAFLVNFQKLVGVHSRKSVVLPLHYRNSVQRPQITSANFSLSSCLTTWHIHTGHRQTPFLLSNIIFSIRPVNVHSWSLKE